jgi:hypothetical protein
MGGIYQYELRSDFRWTMVGVLPRLPLPYLGLAPRGVACAEYRRQSLMMIFRASSSESNIKIAWTSYLPSQVATNTRHPRVCPVSSAVHP